MPSKSLFFRILCVIILSSLASCAPTTIVFIDSPQEPIPTPALPTDTPAPGVIPPPDTPAPTLEVIASVQPTCDKKGNLIETKVNLNVKGGVPPYTIYWDKKDPSKSEEINPEKPAFSLNAGQYNEFNIGSSDGQAVPVKVFAPSKCEDVQIAGNPVSSYPTATVGPVQYPTATTSGIIPTATSVGVIPSATPIVLATATKVNTPVVVIDTPFKFQCSDGLDNDHDGKIDLEDPQCRNKPDDSELDY